MKTNFDAQKTTLELQLEQVAKILERTHPEQTADAMSDYASALSILSNTSDMRVQPIINSLRRLYIYPTRQEHNQLVIELHELLEFLHETRIDQILSSRKKKNLGENSSSSGWVWIVVTVVALIILWRK